MIVEEWNKTYEIFQQNMNSQNWLKHFTIS